MIQKSLFQYLELKLASVCAIEVMVKRLLTHITFVGEIRTSVKYEFLIGRKTVISNLSAARVRSPSMGLDSRNEPPTRTRAPLVEHGDLNVPKCISVFLIQTR